MLDHLKANLKWLAAIIVACSIAFGAGWYSKKPVEVVQVEERVVEKVVEKIVEIEKKKQQKVTKVTKKPDGTTTTTIIDTNTETSVSEKGKTSELDREASTTTEKPAALGDAYRPSFSAGVEAVTDFKELSLSYRASLGYRILGNAWLQGSYDVKRNELGAGVRIDF